LGAVWFDLGFLEVDKKLTDQWKKLNNVLIGTTKGGRNNQLINFVSEGKTISVKCFGDVAAGEAIALRDDDDGIWYVSSQKQSIKAEFRREIEYRKTKTKANKSVDFIGFYPFRYNNNPNLFINVLTRYNNGEINYIDPLDPNDPASARYDVYRDLLPFVGRFDLFPAISYNQMYFEDAILNCWIGRRPKSSAIASTSNTLDYSWIKYDFSADSFEVFDYSIIHSASVGSISYEQNYICKYKKTPDSEISLIIAKCPWDTLTFGFCYIFELTKTMGSGVIPASYMTLAFRGTPTFGGIQVRGIYGVVGGIVVMYQEGKIFIPYRLLEGQANVVTSGLDIIVEKNPGSTLEWFNGVDPIIYVDGIVPAPLDTRKPFLIQYEDNEYNELLESYRLNKHAEPELYASYVLNLGREDNLFYPVYSDDIGQQTFNSKIDVEG
jgi:hypothetical protein